jgi:hypothetical protein
MEGFNIIAKRQFGRVCIDEHNKVFFQANGARFQIGRCPCAGNFLVGDFAAVAFLKVSRTCRTSTSD